MRTFLLVLLSLIVLAAPAPATAAPVPVPIGESVNDYAELLSVEDLAAIALLGEELWASHQVPLVVVTITQMSDYITVEAAPDFKRFTDIWMNAWAVGEEGTSGREAWLFVSKEDREARLALGEAYDENLQLEVQMLLLDHLIPDLKQNRWSAGILKTSNALGEFVREHLDPLPLSPESTPAH